MKEKVHGRFGYIRKNGVYIALAVSVLAVGGVMAFAFGQSQSVAEQNPVETPVEQIVTGQPDERTTTTTQMNTTTSAVQQEDALYVLPLSNTVQKVFSIDAPLYSDTMADWRLHTGADFAGKEGQTVKAIAGGTVAEIKEDPLWGGLIVIDHGVGVQSRYCGVSPTVKVGDEVDICAPIGNLSEVPCEVAQAAHLHLEMLVDGQPVDPVAAIALEVRYGETTE